MSKTFTFYSDPCHGWLKVTPQDLAATKLQAKDFSRYSYSRNGTLYLEEDCDAPKFTKAWVAENPGEEFSIVEKFASKASRIRSYSHNVEGDL